MPLVPSCCLTSGETPELLNGFPAKLEMAKRGDYVTRAKQLVKKPAGAKWLQPVKVLLSWSYFPVILYADTIGIQLREK